ncbi:MAG: outer-membrane lipoprotein carrier protein LolA [Prevotella sp.]|nr:outer-membrane lipoprotein carrier protein LolA [Prevotella sp.]
MKRILTITFALLLTMGMGAQNASKAKQILDKTAAIVSNKGGASANFTISGQKTGNTSGTILIKGNKFQATTPQAIVWYNGQTMWTYMKNSDEVNVSTPNESQQAQLNPYHFINLYKKGYTLGMKNVKGGYEVHLTAQNSKQSVKEMYITVNSRNYLPTKVRMLHGGNWTTVTISNFKAMNLSDSKFTFNSKDYPQAEVIDLR